MTDFEKKVREEGSKQEPTVEYDAFIEKFKAKKSGTKPTKKSTDECYTPPNIYQTVCEYVMRKYEKNGAPIVRPFYPGGDYEKEEYPAGCVVLDNPPFSIITKIVRFYQNRSIDFFLFAPTLTLFDVARGEANYVVADVRVIYQNGAVVNTSFVTNLGVYKIDCDANLNQLLRKENDKNRHTKTAPSRTISLAPPDELITAATLGKILRRGKNFTAKAWEVRTINKLDNAHKEIFGGGIFVE